MRSALIGFLALFVCSSVWASNPLLNSQFVSKQSVYDYVQQLELGADIHAQDALGNTPLHVATVWSESARKAQLLIEAGADVNKAGFLGNTPLHLAANKFEPRKVSLLLEHGADVNAINAKGQTPIMIAAKQGDEKVVAELLAYGADVTIKDNTGWTALHHVATYGSVKTITAFKFSGADVNAKTNLGQTPLQFATSMSNHAGAAILVSLGADPYAERSNGESIIGYQAALRDKKMLQALFEKKQFIESESSTFTMPLPADYCNASDEALAKDYRSYLQKEVFGETIHSLWAPCDQAFNKRSWLALASVENSNIASNQPVLRQLFEPLVNDRPFEAINEIGKVLTIDDFSKAITVHLSAADTRPALMWANDFVHVTSARHVREGQQPYFYVVAQMVYKEMILSYHLRIGEEDIDQLARLLHRLAFYGQAVRVMAQTN